MRIAGAITESDPRHLPVAVSASGALQTQAVWPAFKSIYREWRGIEQELEAEVAVRIYEDRAIGHVTPKLGRPLVAHSVDMSLGRARSEIRPTVA
jgi:hypothetical protein